jgi:hypothetical protein
MTYNLSMESGRQKQIKNSGLQTGITEFSYTVAFSPCFFEYAAQSEGIEHIGLSVGQDTSFDDSGIYDYMIQQSHTV